MRIIQDKESNAWHILFQSNLELLRLAHLFYYVIQFQIITM